MKFCQCVVLLVCGLSGCVIVPSMNKIGVTNIREGTYAVVYGSDGEPAIIWRTFGVEIAKISFGTTASVNFGEVASDCDVTPFAKIHRIGTGEFLGIERCPETLHFPPSSYEYQYARYNYGRYEHYCPPNFHWIIGEGKLEVPLPARQGATQGGDEDTSSQEERRRRGERRSQTELILPTAPRPDGPPQLGDPPPGSIPQFPVGRRSS
jgi:hypothetical protein